MDFNLKTGMTSEKAEPVTAENTAKKYGSGSIDVYATPAMIGLMEGACLQTVDTHLSENMSTVGIALNVKHIAATPIGMTVKAIATLTAIEGKKLTFSVEAFDDKDKIGEGTHERYIIDIDKFITRTNSKLL